MAKSKLEMEQDDKAQSGRFIRKARELEADETAEAFDRAFKRVVPPKSHPSGKKRSAPTSDQESGDNEHPS